MDYYIIQNGEANGPYTIGQLRAMWNSGAITGTTLYCREGWSEWIPLSGMIEELEPPASVPPPKLSSPLFPFKAPKSKRNIAIIVGLGAVILLIIANAPSDNSRNNTQESAVHSDRPPLAEIPPSIDTNSVVGTLTPPPIYDSSASQPVGVGTKSGLSLAELAAMIGYQLPKGQSVSYYSREIRAGVVAFDPNYQLTSYDEATIDSTASILAGK
jgi:hypothetical protein